MTEPNPVAPSSRLVALRAAGPSDAATLQRWRSEPTVRRFQPLTDVSQGQLRAELANQQLEGLYRGRGDKFQWIVTYGSLPAGWITLVVANWDHGVAEIGYALSTRWQRRGLMPLALEQLTAEVFCRTSLERIEARCAVENRASAKVLESVGFRREGRLRGFFVLDGERVDNYLYALLRDDWMP